MRDVAGAECQIGMGLRVANAGLVKNEELAFVTEAAPRFSEIRYGDAAWIGRGKCLPERNGSVRQQQRRDCQSFQLIPHHSSLQISRKELTVKLEISRRACRAAA